MKTTNCNKEDGIALLLSMLALLLLSAVAVGMIYMASTENSIAGNFKSEETEYFAARAGVEEARDRLIPLSTNAINQALLPASLPSTTGGVLYFLQNDTNMTMAKVTSGGPATNPMYDDELCHDYAFGTMANAAPNVRCGLTSGTALPSGTGWYGNQSVTSIAPNWNSSGTANAMDWRWSRVTLKATNSTPYCVDSTHCTAATVKPVCYDGTSEQAMTGASCGAMGFTPVYLITSLATNSTTSTNGTRRLVQAEVAQTPQTSGQSSGLFATGTGCGALTFEGNAQTGSFSSAGESSTSPTAPTVQNSGGDVGANGGIAVNGTAAHINGNVASTLPKGKTGCPTTAITVSGSPTIGSESVVPAYNPVTPAIPSNVPQTACTIANACITTNQSCTVNNKGKKTCTTTGYSLAPGTYGNIQLSAQDTVSLQSGTTGNPAVYNINSLTESGQATFTLSGPPFGPVVINIAGNGATTVLDLTGGSFSNSSYVPSNLTFNYGGTGIVNMKGNSSAFFVLNAPKATLNLSGTSSFYGAAVAKTIDVAGTPNFYYDTSLVTPTPTNTSAFSILTMRELSY